MLYDFRCKTCDHEQVESFLANDYDKKVHEDGRLKRKRCKNCKTITLYRHITKAPDIMGGTKGYMSMERWWKQNPDHYKRKEAELQKQMGDRHRKRVLDKINKEIGGGKRDDRHKDYGSGQSEGKLSSDD